MAEKLSSATEVLFRQIHPNSLHDGEPGSDRFRPSALDNNKLSVDRSSMTTAAAAFALYTQDGNLSAAVFGLTVGEFDAEAIVCFEDKIKDHPTLPDNDAHALADFSKHTASKQKLIAKRLKKQAVARGCLYRPEAA